MNPKKTGFVLLETLVCLAILGILLPVSQKYILFVHEKFQKARLRLQAAQIACTELRYLEARSELGNAGKKDKDLSGRSVGRFLVKSEIQPAEFTLQEMTVQVEWQYRGNPEIYALKEFYIPNQKAEKNDIPSHS